MDMSALLAMLVEKFPWALIVLGILGSLVVVGQAVVILTPSKADDAVLEGLEKHSIFGAIINALKSFAPIQKK